MKKRIIAVLCIVVVISVIIGMLVKNKNNSKEELTVINLNEVTRSVFYAPQYVAIKNNYLMNINY